jgi:hypothetical protein
MSALLCFSPVPFSPRTETEDAEADGIPNASQCHAGRIRIAATLTLHLGWLDSSAGGKILIVEGYGLYSPAKKSFHR